MYRIFRSIILNFLIIFSSWIIYFFIESIEIPLSLMIFHNLLVTMNGVFSFFYNRENRKNFLINHEVKEKNEWYQSVLENMNSGLILIRNNKIVYMNNYFKEKVYTNSKFANKLYKINKIIHNKKDGFVMNKNDFINSERIIKRNNFINQLEEKFLFYKKD